MAKLDIKPFGNKFSIVDSDGNPFGAKLYATERGAKQAISKAGHTYKDDKPKAKAKTGKSKKNAQNRVDMPEDEILALRQDCLDAAGFKSGMSKEEVSACDWAEANRVAVAGGFSSYYAVKSVARGIKWSRKSDAERAEIKNNNQTRKADREADKAAVSSGEVTQEIQQARNALARVNGFKRYRELCRAAERGDAHAKAVKALIDKQIPFAVVSKRNAA